MTIQTQTALVFSPDVDPRLIALSALYDDLNTTLNLQMAELRKGDLSQGKPIIKKLDELCSVLLALIKAEEAYHEKIKSTAGAERVDAEILRADIGRKLDRIRATRNAEEVSGGPDG